MYRDFYAAIAATLPLLLLALMWDSNYLLRLRRQRRLPRRVDPVGGVVFWTKPRVRIYSLTVTAALVGSTAAALLVLAGLIPDTTGLRAGLAAGAGLALATLLVRISSDVITATRPIRPPPAIDELTELEENPGRLAPALPPPDRTEGSE